MLKMRINSKIINISIFVAITIILLIYLVQNYTIAYYSDVKGNNLAISINLITYELTSESSSFNSEDKTVTIAANSTEDLIINVQSLNNIDTLYNLNYTVKIGEDIDVEYYPDGDMPTGTIGKYDELETSDNVQISLKITNNDSLESVIELREIGGYEGYSLLIPEGNINIPQIQLNKNFSYTESIEEYVVPMSGYYNVEMWGASRISTGAYTRGDIYLEKNEKLYFNVGGAENNVATNTNTYGGYNGGGHNSGGATDLRLGNTVAYPFGIVDPVNGGIIGATHGGTISNGVITLPQGATAYGPYDSYEAGVYLVTYVGTNLKTSSTFSSYVYRTHTIDGVDHIYKSVISTLGSTRATYIVTLYEDAEKLEFLFVNNDTSVATITEITVENIGSRIMVAGGAGIKDNSVAGGLIAPTYSLATGGTQIKGGIITDPSPNYSYSGNFYYGARGYEGTTQGGGGGYYGGAGDRQSSSGGSSFISGYPGVNAINKVGATTGIQHSNNTIHYSNKYFKNASMKAGNNLMPTHDGTGTMNGNLGNGYAKIAYIGSEPEKQNILLNNVRYIKDCINGSTLNNYKHWVEIQAIANGVNLAKNKTVTGTVAEETLYPYSRITDGDLTLANHARISPVGRHCVTVDLETIYNLDEVAVWHNYDGRKYFDNSLQVSNDNINWTTVIQSYEAEVSDGKRFSAYQTELPNRTYLIRDGAAVRGGDTLVKGVYGACDYTPTLTKLAHYYTFNATTACRAGLALSSAIDVTNINYLVVDVEGTIAASTGSASNFSTGASINPQTTTLLTGWADPYRYILLAPAINVAGTLPRGEYTFDVRGRTGDHYFGIGKNVQGNINLTFNLYNLYYY